MRRSETCLPSTKKKKKKKKQKNNHIQATPLIRSHQTRRLALPGGEKTRDPPYLFFLRCSFGRNPALRRVSGRVFYTRKCPYHFTHFPYLLTLISFAPEGGVLDDGSGLAEEIRETIRGGWGGKKKG